MTSRGPRGSSLQNIYRGIVVTIQDQTTNLAPVDSSCQRLRDGGPTTTAIDARVMRRDSLEQATSFFRFVCRYIEKAAPACVGYAIWQMTVSNHVSDLQVFDSDQAAGVDDFSCFPVVEVISLVPDFPVEGGHNLPGFLPVGPALLSAA